MDSSTKLIDSAYSDNKIELPEDVALFKFEEVRDEYNRIASFINLRNSTDIIIKNGYAMLSGNAAIAVLNCFRKRGLNLFMVSDLVSTIRNKPFYGFQNSQIDRNSMKNSIADEISQRYPDSPNVSVFMKDGKISRFSHFENPDIGEEDIPGILDDIEAAYANVDASSNPVGNYFDILSVKLYPAKSSNSVTWKSAGKVACYAKKVNINGEEVLKPCFQGFRTYDVISPVYISLYDLANMCVSHKELFSYIIPSKDKNFKKYSYAMYILSDLNSTDTKLESEFVNEIMSYIVEFTTLMTEKVIMSAFYINSSDLRCLRYRLAIPESIIHLYKKSNKVAFDQLYKLHELANKDSDNHFEHTNFMDSDNLTCFRDAKTIIKDTEIVDDVERFIKSKIGIQFGKSLSDIVIFNKKRGFISQQEYLKCNKDDCILFARNSINPIDDETIWSVIEYLLNEQDSSAEVFKSFIHKLNSDSSLSLVKFEMDILAGSREFLLYNHVIQEAVALQFLLNNGILCVYDITTKNFMFSEDFNSSKHDSGIKTEW